MGSIISPFVNIEQKPFAWDKGVDIEGYILDNIAQDVQTRLRSRLDNGADMGAAVRARTVQVRNEEGRLTIKAEETDDDHEQTTIDDLFRATNPSPYIENNKLIFRQIREQDINRRNLETVVNSIEESLRINLDRHVQDAVRQVISANPDLSQ